MPTPQHAVGDEIPRTTGTAPYPDPSAKADITFSVPRFQSPGTDRRRTA
ncbi:MAG TPA: hypothetical protein VLK84_00855 [Longimicrobium sp.]|nr:hypothetical protein [Longimicrobium sp.]